jgi:hypothetical protein
MSKTKARSAKSYANEKLALAMLPEILEASGFVRVRVLRRGQMKFADVTDLRGAQLRFWIKQGWTDTPNFSAIQFGLFAGPAGEQLSDKRFIEQVSNRVDRVKREGATHALLIHMVNAMIVNWVALAIDDVLLAYTDQIGKWPNRARNTKSATLWFEDSRGVEGS